MSPPDPRRALYRPLIAAGVALLATLLVGTMGYHQIGTGRWSWEDCLYMTVITLATVGYGEVLPGMDHIARAWTMGLIVLGSGTLLYFVSTFTAFIVEGDIRGVIRRNRMQKKLDELTGHILVCGVGSTGVHVVEELIATEAPFVVIDKSEERIARVMEEVAPSMNFVIGDATDDHTLEQAGIGRARGVVAALHDDKDNLFVTVTARALNPNLRIVAKAIEPSASAKMRRAGANSVVSPNLIGGMRLVSEMVRPAVVQFLDQMLRDKDKNLRIEEVAIPTSSPMVGVCLRDSKIRDAADVLVIAVKKPKGGYIYNPPPSLTLEENMVLIVLGQSRDVTTLRQSILRSN